MITDPVNGTVSRRQSLEIKKCSNLIEPRHFFTVYVVYFRALLSDIRCRLILERKYSVPRIGSVHQKDREVWSENDFHLISDHHRPIFRKMVKAIATEFLTDDRDRKYYADHYKCCPPPFFIIFMTLIELGFFIYYTVMAGGDVKAGGPVPIDSLLIYRPDKRLEIWRFLLYTLLHAGWLHLSFNLIVQLLVGLPLEMVHGSLRIGTVYMAGVLAGSLGTSIFDSDVYLVGASGGVYALLAAHLANVLLNYNQMEFGVFRLIGVFLVDYQIIRFIRNNYGKLDRIITRTRKSGYIGSNDEKVESEWYKQGVGLFMEMSFLGYISQLMAGTGLAQVLEVTYTENDLKHMLTGKAIYIAVRGHVMAYGAPAIILEGTA
ncbi:Protein rhomboid [Nymphon striatum]|nr:Protein rhomboid [Nymphon striatum]